MTTGNETVSFSHCESCHARGDCAATGECLDAIMLEAFESESAYVARGVCSDCGAVSPEDASGKCKPRQCPSGEWGCGGDRLWEDQE